MTQLLEGLWACHGGYAINKVYKKTIKLLKLILDQPIAFTEIPYFRSAIIDTFQKRASLYDNHDERGGDKYRYPLVQYKRSRGKASIFFLEEGVFHFLKSPLVFPKRLRIGSREQAFGIELTPLQEFTVRIDQDHPQVYKIARWMALNQKNHQRYTRLSALEKISFLERLLSNHLISFFKGINWQPKQRFSIKITDLPTQREQWFKGGYKATFTLRFTTDLQLPHFIGLGKAPSVGYGVISAVPRESRSPSSWY